MAVQTPGCTFEDTVPFDTNWLMVKFCEPLQPEANSVLVPMVKQIRCHSLSMGKDLDLQYLFGKSWVSMLGAARSVFLVQQCINLNSLKESKQV